VRGRASHGSRLHGWAFSPLGFIRRVFVGGYEDNIPFLASALTFDALLWILPLLLVALAGFGYVVGGDGSAVPEIHSLLSKFLPEYRGPDNPFSRIENALVAVVQSRTQLSVYGAPFFVWLSWRLFGSIRAALNDVFDTEETRNWFVGKGIDLVLAVVSALLITGNMLMTVLVVQAPWLGRFLAGVSAYGFAALLFFVVYTVAPSRKVQWDTALVASVVASLAFEVVKRLYGAYLVEFATFDRVVSNSNFIALLLFVLWMYVTSFIFLAGGEVAETYDLARRQREQRALLA
jgi:membrane protein